MAFATRNDLYQNIAKGLGVNGVYHFVSNGSGQTAVSTTVTTGVGQGHVNSTIMAQTIGTTFPGTLQKLVLPGVDRTERLNFMGLAGSGSGGQRGAYLGYLYELGTLNLAATGNQFTHHSATFPVLRTVFGVASQAISLIPFLQVTTATTTTAPVVRLRTATDTAGYNDQDGNATIGVKTLTFPNAATELNTCLTFRLEAEDNGVRDITQIRVDTAAAAGAAKVWGFEPLVPLPRFASSYPYYIDAITYGLLMPDLKPAVATSGTANAILGIVSYLNTNAAAEAIHIIGAYSV